MEWAWQDLNLRPIDYERIEILIINIIKGDFHGAVPRNVPQKLITGEGVSFRLITDTSVKSDHFSEIKFNLSKK